MRKQHLCYRILALILAILLLPNVFSGLAANEDPVVALDTLTQSLVESEASWNKFKEGFSAATSSQTVTFRVEGKVILPEPLVNENGASFIITGDGAGSSTITPGSSDSFNEHSYLINVSKESKTSTFTICGLTLDGGKKCGLLRVRGYHRVYVGKEKVEGEGVVFQNGLVGLSTSGSVQLDKIGGGTIWYSQFLNNIGDFQSGTTGCLYVSATDENSGLYIYHTLFEGTRATRAAPSMPTGRNATSTLMRTALLRTTTPTSAAARSTATQRYFQTVQNIQATGPMDLAGSFISPPPTHLRKTRPPWLISTACWF